MRYNKRYYLVNKEACRDKKLTLTSKDSLLYKSCLLYRLKVSFIPYKRD